MQTTESRPYCHAFILGKREEQLPQFGGTAYRTCGSAYIVQKKYIPTKDIQKSKEDSILEKIETDLSIKNNLEDPMPPFQSVEQRMLDLAERRLHPFYKRYLSMARPMNIEEDKNTLELRQPYKCKSGPIQLEDIPAHLKLSKEVLETKNIFADFKGVELPKQMLAKIIEIEENRKPTLEKGSKKENKNDK